MLIVSNRLGSSKIFFEAPPSKKVFDEMTQFIHWFNSCTSSDSILARAAISHVYFESIHPFEDGNEELDHCNQSLDASNWVEFFAEIILQAQNDSMQFLRFLIEKSKMLTSLSGYHKRI